MLEQFSKIKNINAIQGSNNINIYNQHSEQHNQLLQLEAYRNNLKAVQYYFTKMSKKVFIGLIGCQQIMIQEKITRCYLQRWKIYIKMCKIEVMRKIILLKGLRKNRDQRLNKNMNKIRQMTAENCYQRCLKAKVFQQWKVTLKNEKKELQLNLSIKSLQIKRFILSCQLKQSQRFTNNLASSISKQKILKKYFVNWVQAIKSNKIKQKKFHKFSIKFIRYLKIYCRQQKTIYSFIYQKKLKKKTLAQLKQFASISKALRHYYRKIIIKYFQNWIQASQILFYQKQDEIKNQQILKSYIQRKQKFKTIYYFQLWKAIIQQKKQNINKNQIAKQYGEIKQKQFLLRKYFNCLKQIKQINKAEKLYRNKLITKAVTILKQQTIKSANKWVKIYNFIQDRQRRKYFQSVKTFIVQQKEKIRKFKTIKSWQKFTFALAKDYILKNTKSETYYKQSLKFKSFYAFKQAISLNKKINKTIIYINANMNLKRWRKSHRVKIFYQNRKFITKAKIFRQLKLKRMSKLWSSKQIEQKQLTIKKECYFTNPINITQTSISFEKLTLENQDHLLSLNYSISGYNSNNLYDNF